MDQVNEGIRKVKENDVKYRVVLKNDEASRVMKKDDEMNSLIVIFFTVLHIEELVRIYSS